MGIMGGRMSVSSRSSVDSWGYGSSEGLSGSPAAGKVGLHNMGNTCFMNAALQCLAHIDPLVAYFLDGKYRDEINITSPHSTKGEVVCSFADLLQDIWQRPQAAVRPETLRTVLQRRAPHLFDYYEQQDAQEFLAYCLDQLHEDLNRVERPPPPRTEAEEEAEEERQASLDEEFVAALSWMRYLERGKSFLVDLFQGQLRSSLTCRSCGHRARKFDPFLYLSVPVDSGGATSSIAGAVEQYLEEELLVHEERWLCPKCKRKVDTTKKIDLWKLPPVLVLHLKRFEFVPKKMRFRKLEKLLTSPLTLDLSKHTESFQREHALYDIVAVANHVGPYGSGHYTAVCRLPAAEGSEADAWYHFDDARVRAVSAAQVVTKDSYVLFLTRRAGAGTPAIHRQSCSLPEVWPHFVSTRNSKVLDFYMNRGRVSGSTSELGSDALTCVEVVEAFRTKVISNVSTAVWDTEFQVIFAWEVNDSIEFRVFDRDLLGGSAKDDLLGFAELRSSSLYPNGFNGTLPLLLPGEGDDGGSAGGSGASGHSGASGGGGGLGRLASGLLGRPSGATIRVEAAVALPPPGSPPNMTPALRLRVVGASGLRDADAFAGGGGSDPYCVVSVRKMARPREASQAESLLSELPSESQSSSMQTPSRGHSPGRAATRSGASNSSGGPRASRPRQPGRRAGSFEATMSSAEAPSAAPAIR